MASSTEVRVWADGPIRLLATTAAVAIVVFAVEAAGYPVPALLGWALILLGAGLSIVVSRQPSKAAFVPAPARSFWLTCSYGLCLITAAMLLRTADALGGYPSTWETAAEVLHGAGAATMIWRCSGYRSPSEPGSAGSPSGWTSPS